jgi:hypothetical protein
MEGAARLAKARNSLALETQKAPAAWPRRFTHLVLGVNCRHSFWFKVILSCTREPRRFGCPYTSDRMREIRLLTWRNILEEALE